MKKRYRKKKVLIFFSIFICFLLAGCTNKNREIVLSIKANLKEESCIPTELDLYDDGSYKIYTKYKKGIDNDGAVPPMYIYTESNEGKYDFDYKLIVENLEELGDNANDINYIITDYESGMAYQIKNGETNKELDELLENIDVDLDMCLEEDK